MHPRRFAALAGTAGLAALALGATGPLQGAAAGPAYNSIVFAPNPIAPAGSLGTSAEVDIKVQPEQNGTPVSGATVYLSIHTDYTTNPSFPGGSACITNSATGTSCTGATLTTTPTAFTSDSTGSIYLLYTAPSAYPSDFRGRDVISGADSASDTDSNGLCTSGVCNTDIYVYSPVTKYVFNPSPIAPQGSLSPGGQVTGTITAVDATGHPVPSSVFFVTLDGQSGPPAGSASITDVSGTQASIPDTSACMAKLTSCRFTSNSSGQVSFTYTAGNASGASDTLSAFDHPTHHVIDSDQYVYGGGLPINGFTMDAYGAVYHFGNLGSSGGTGSRLWSFKIARGLAVWPTSLNPSSGGFILDGYGGIHPFGGASTVAIAVGPYWHNWDIARGIALNPCDPTYQSGYIVDGYGGIQAWYAQGDTHVPPKITNSPYFGFDIARGIVSSQCDSSGMPGGYVLDGYGGIHAWGSAPAAPPHAGYWGSQHWDIARGIAAAPCSSTTVSCGGYFIDGFGKVWTFDSGSTAPPVLNGAPYFGFDIARGVTSYTSGAGYVLDGYGGVHPVGAAAAPAPTSIKYFYGQDIVRAIQVTT